MKLAWTSETFSYWLWLEAMHGRLSGDWVPFNAAWKKMEEAIIPSPADQVWPLLRDKFPSMRVTVVAGPVYVSYWQAFADSPEPQVDSRIELLGFVEDVRPLYNRTNLVLVPTTVSAGTNVKVLEAMAMRRAVISTPSGCAGLGLLHGHSVWEAETKTISVP